MRRSVTVFTFLPFVASLVLFACEKERPHQATIATDSDRALVLPTKDDVAMVNGQRLSLAQFSSLHDALGQPNPETTLWVGLGAMALQEWFASTHHVTVGATDCILLSRFASGELEPALLKDLKGSLPIPLEQAALHDQINRLLKNSRIVRNPHALSEFHEKAR